MQACKPTREANTPEPLPVLLCAHVTYRVVLDGQLAVGCVCAWQGKGRSVSVSVCRLTGCLHRHVFVCTCVYTCVRACMRVQTDRQARAFACVCLLMQAGKHAFTFLQLIRLSSLVHPEDGVEVLAHGWHLISGLLLAVCWVCVSLLAGGCLYSLLNAGSTTHVRVWCVCSSWFTACL